MRFFSVVKWRFLEINNSLIVKKRLFLIKNNLPDIILLYYEFSTSHLSAMKNIDIAPSKTFQRKIFKVSLSLLFFATMYLVLALAFLGLTVLSFAFCYSMFSQSVNFITVFLGFGVLGLNLMIIYFLFKSIFQKSVIDRSGMIEITGENEPKLFHFIKKITEETNTPFPKKIFLSPHVNAAVFYDSSFWSMFLPVQKNLQIGLGLVNSANIAEFKAILAHEFAHFSQKSMRFGSYVYHANLITYNMLYDNDGYTRTIRSWAKISGGFSFFVKITVWIVIKIQWIMQKLYTVVNRNYMSLSREMEFHADAIAVVVAGSNNLKASLLNQEPADLCYNKVLQFYDLWANDCVKTDNIYPDHRALLKRFALDNDIEWVNDQMMIGGIENLNITPRRVNIKDQWASHPTVQDRIQRIMLSDVVKMGDHSSTWSLFGNPEALQKQMTAKVYERIEFEKEPTTIDNTAFCEKIDAYFAKQKFDAFYKGYFDTHDMIAFDLEAIVENVSPASNESGLDDLDKLLNRDNLSLTKKLIGLRDDIRLLDDILNKRYSVKTFDFDGNKFKTQEAPRIRKILTDAFDGLIFTQTELDEGLFRLFYSRAMLKGTAEFLVGSYSMYIENNILCSKQLQLIDEMYEVINPFYVEKLTLKKAFAINEKAKLKELEVKNNIVSAIENIQYQPLINDKASAAFQAFLNEDRPYFEEGIIRDEVFRLLIDALNAFQDVVNAHKYNIKSNYLNFQLSLFDDWMPKK